MNNDDIDEISYSSVEYSIDNFVDDTSILDENFLEQNQLTEENILNSPANSVANLFVLLWSNLIRSSENTDFTIGTAHFQSANIYFTL